MRVPFLIGMFCLLGLLPPASSAQEAAVPSERVGQVDYLKQVKPLLRERCYSCHGGLKQQAELRLDTAASILRGGESGPAISKTEPAKSLLLARVAAKDIAERMPPEHEGEALTPAQIDLLRDWIHSGVTGPTDETPEADPRDHWAFRPIKRPPIPQVALAGWVSNPIDSFVARQYQQHGLSPQPEASRSVLLRRLTFDLIGLPPTADEIAAFEHDPAPDWYERAVTRLLNDPRYGERWGRHWMDVWRYSDWWGLGDQLRNSQKHIWHWRDWIVESLNDDVPYDEMVRLMLAADELHPNDLDKLRATGYLARNYFLFNRHQWMDETVEHVAKGFLGLTVNCAKCHDHKYDPISHADYYRLRAFFEPYHVRMDVTPQEADLTRDGIPRAFDGLLDAPTYRFIRGQENHPDKTTIIAPGVPEVLAFEPLRIEAVELPIEAWQPQRRAWVAAAYRAAAQSRLAAAEAQLTPARAKLAAAERSEAEVLAKTDAATKESVAETKPEGELIVEKFATLDAKRWKLFGGDWLHAAGKLEQKRDGAQRAALRWTGKMPRDFEATLRFSILGGSQWRSVGIAFDANQPDPIAEPGPDHSEQNVYVSAYAAGPKVQAAWQRAGKWQYPTEAMVARPIELKHEYTLRVQVREDLINVALDGEPVLAWRSPLERRDGSFQVTTFDALAVLHEVTLAPLKPEVKLREPGKMPANPLTPAGAAHAVADARGELSLLELTISSAKAELHSVEQRAAALQSTAAATVTGETIDSKSLARAAARAEREHAVAQARVALASAELRLHRASADKRESLSKELASAKESLEKSLQHVADSSEQFTSFVGAQWTPTRFINSSADDPTVTFPQRSTGRRRALADWITDRRNPLTARVAVNQIWMRHFGTPLVATVFDFGRKGSQPRNPELLDWLAVEFVDSGWSMKHLHRLMVQSATYRLSSSSVGAEQNLAKDPENAYLWRRTASRLESQAVRDAILALAGTLDSTQGGPPVPAANQVDSTRRSLYFFHSNNERNLFLTTFDEALVKECYRREQSIVPQQALAMTNSRLVLDSSQPIATRLTQNLDKEKANDDEAFIRLAFKTLLGSEPNAAELDASIRSLKAWKQLSDARQGDEATSFARMNLVWVLLNHNDFVTVR